MHQYQPTNQTTNHQPPTTTTTTRTTASPSLMLKKITSKSCFTRSCGNVGHAAASGMAEFESPSAHALSNVGPPLATASKSQKHWDQLASCHQNSWPIPNWSSNSFQVTRSMSLGRSTSTSCDAMVWWISPQMEHQENQIWRWFHVVYVPKMFWDTSEKLHQHITNIISNVVDNISSWYSPWWSRALGPNMEIFHISTHPISTNDKWRMKKYNTEGRTPQWRKKSIFWLIHLFPFPPATRVLDGWRIGVKALVPGRPELFTRDGLKMVKVKVLENCVVYDTMRDKTV